MNLENYIPHIGLGITYCILAINAYAGMYYRQKKSAFERNRQQNRYGNIFIYSLFACMGTSIVLFESLPFNTSASFILYLSIGCIVSWNSLFALLGYSRGKKIYLRAKKSTLPEPKAVTM